MPIYQYECRNCNQDFEQRQSFSDSPLTDCPLCGTEGSVNRIVSQVGVIFKGSGFYINDSKNNNRSSGSGSEDKPKKSETTETKTADNKVAESNTSA